MKTQKLLLLLITMFVVFSCKQPQQKNAELERVLHQREDSIKRAMNDSLALIAWGNLKFGISEKEALQGDFFKGSEISFNSIIIGSSLDEGGYYGNSISLEYDAVRAFEETFGLQTNIRSFDAKFEESELTDIVIASYDYSASHIDELIDDCHIYIENFKSKLGKPTYLKENVSINDFNEGQGFIIAKFKVGDKEVNISLHESYSGSEYSYQVHIFNKSFPKKKHKYTDDEMSKIKKRQETRDKITSNSF